MAKKLTKPTPKQQRKVPIINFTVRSVEDYKTLVNEDSTKDVIMSYTVDAIKFAISEDLQDVDLFRLDNEYVIYNLSRDKFKSTLQKAQRFYSDKSQFEKCLDVQSMLQVL